MRKLTLALLLAASSAAFAQTRLPVVLTLPGVEKVEVRKDTRYDGEHTFDLYRPGGSRGTLPVVLFLNATGDPQLKEWGQYTTWPRLVAARGMAAITYQTSGNRAGEQTQELLKYLKANAASLKIDASRIALWAASTNVSGGTALLAAQAPADFRAAVFYYGPMNTAPKHADVPVLVARAGLDSLSIIESIDRWIAQAVALDAPLTVMTYPEGVHAFDLRNETEEAREIIRRTLDFLHFHLNNPRRARTQPMTPAQLTRIALQSIDDAIGKIMELRKSHPRALVVQEEAINLLGYDLLGAGRTAEAVKLFELMVKMYPGSPNAFDSLGDGYAAAGRDADAVTAAERAITLLRMLPPDQREPIRRNAEEKIQRLKK